MADLGIDNDLIGWIQSFLMRRCVELVIDGFTNLKQKIEIGILQGSHVSPILFFIYISGVFSVIEIKLPDITYVSFVDDLIFLTSDRSIKKMAIFLEQVEKIALE